MVGLVPGWARRGMIRGTLAHPTADLNLHLVPRPSPHTTLLLNLFPAPHPDPQPTVRVSPHATLGLSPYPDMGVRQA